MDEEEYVCGMSLIIEGVRPRQNAERDDEEVGKERSDVVPFWALSSRVEMRSGSERHIMRTVALRHPSESSH